LKALRMLALGEQPRTSAGRRSQSWPIGPSP
jgi:hypothetical protein